MWSYDKPRLLLLSHRALAHTLTNTSNALVDYTLHDRAFAPNVWDKFFLLCAKFLTQHCLELERLSDYQKHLYQQQLVPPPPSPSLPLPPPPPSPSLPPL